MINQIFICLIAGFLSFFSPCVFPMIPVFLMSLSQNTNKFVGTLMFSVGLTLAFLSIGLIASSFGDFLAAYMDPINFILSCLLILFGVFTLIPRNIPLFSQTFKINLPAYNISNLFGPLLMGFTFGFGWSPCVGPVLAGVISMAINEDTLFNSLILLSVYSSGMCIPLFGFAAMGTTGCVYNSIKRYTPIIEKFGGICLIGFGLWRIFH